MKKQAIAAMLAMALLLACGCGMPQTATKETESPAEAAVQASPPPTQEPSATAEPTTTPEPTPTPEMTVESCGIVDGAMDIAYGAKGEQKTKSGIPTRSLPLTVRNIPAGTTALALTMIDPDGRNWVHWLAADILVDGTDCEIPENASIEWMEQLVQGRSDFGTDAYGGPMPPSGVHTYVITVYALSEPLELNGGFQLKTLTAAMEGKVLADAVVTGTYEK